METLQVASRQPCKTRRGGGRNRVEYAQEGIRISLLVAGDQFGVVKIVAGVHSYARRYPTAHLVFLVFREQRYLYAVNLPRIVVDDAEKISHSRSVIGRAPVTSKRRVEHVPEPMNDARLAPLP